MRSVANLVVVMTVGVMVVNWAVTGGDVPNAVILAAIAGLIAVRPPVGRSK